jgi:hypothetical protein
MKVFDHAHAFEIQNESMAWDLAALAVFHLASVGCYRAPSESGGPTVFLALQSVRAFAPPDRRPCVRDADSARPQLSHPDQVG